MAKVSLKPTGMRKRTRELLADLNDVQVEAARHTEGPLLILAGAGSGKTRVLTYRVAYLIDRGVAPYNILALTFTNKAAGEMKERIAGLVGQERTAKLWVGTFHSTFARILRREAKALGYTSSFSIYDGDDSLGAIRKIMTAMGISQQEHAPSAVRAAISSAKNGLITWRQYQESADSLFEKQVGLVYQEYEQRLRRSNAMDFDDLLLNMITLLRNNAELLAKYRSLFQYILVDEYQDTNRAQYTVVSMLAEKHRNLCVVGDDAQSIYRWRGADIRNILQFERDYKDAKVIRLEQNYRSTQTILKVANDVINRNRNQIAKELWTENPVGDSIQVLTCRDDREEALRITDIIKRVFARDSIGYDGFAILYRTNAQSQALEDALRRNNVPYIMVGGVSFYKRKEVKDALAYLKILANPSDDESLLRVINEPARGIGKTSLQRLGAFASDRGISLFEACRKSDDIPHLQKRAKTALYDFSAFIRKYIAVKDNMVPDELGRTYLDATGLLQMYKDDGSEEALDRWNNIQRVLSHLAEYSHMHPDARLEDYLQEVALVDDSNQLAKGKSVVTMLTMHAAKGLEFPVVFIAGLEKGLFPLAKAEQEPDEMEEERRLFYVAITRAERQVFLSHAMRRYRFGELTHPMPSRFLSEIRPELLQQVGAVEAPQASTLGSRVSRGASQSGRPAFANAQRRQAPPKEHYFDDIPPDEDQSYSQVQDEKLLRIGARVEHGVFGKGKVLGLAGQGDMARATVSFPTVGTKNLVLKFAKLKVVG